MVRGVRFTGLFAALCLLLSTSVYADGPAAEPSVRPDPAPPAEVEPDGPVYIDSESLTLSDGESVTLADASLSLLSVDDGRRSARTSPWSLGVRGDTGPAVLAGERPGLSLVRSEIDAGGWGILSTAESDGASITAVDSRLMARGRSAAGASLLGYGPSDPGCGFGLYCGPGTEAYLHGTSFSGTVCGIVLDGAQNVWLGSSTGTIPLYDANGGMTGLARGDGQSSAIDSVFGLMMLSGAGNTVVVDDGTVIRTRDAALLYKGGSGTFTFNNARLAPDNGVLLQMMDSDADGRIDEAGGLYDERDVGGGIGFPGINYAYGPVPPLSGDPDPAAPPAASAGERLSVSYTNGLYQGNVYNGTGWYGQPGDSLDLTVGRGAVLWGDISLTSTVKAIPYSGKAAEALSRLDGVRYALLDETGEQCLAGEAAYIQFTAYTDSQYFLQGHVQNLPCANGASTLDVTVAEGGVWVVRTAALLSRLTVEDGGTVYGEVRQNTDGTVTLSPSSEKLAPGVYEPAEAPDPEPSPTPLATPAPAPTPTPAPQRKNRALQGEDVLHI